MMTNFLMPQRTSNNKVAIVAGVAALAGVALICAIPRTRKACGKWIGSAVDGLKNRFAERKNEGNWERDLASAEKLKGPVEKRRNTSKINVPSAGTTNWKDEWSSE
ncbi:hypothetical protein D3C87_184460 [compost metagenome]